MIKEIKKGDRFRCLNPGIAELGKIFESDQDGSFPNDNGVRYIVNFDNPQSVEWLKRDFELISTKTPAGLDMPATCMPTSDDFPRYSREYLDNMTEVGKNAEEAGMKVAGMFKNANIEKEYNESVDRLENALDLPNYYNNSQGSLYQIAEQRGWGVRLFDIVKRLDRGGKKDPLRQEIEKSIGVLQLWLKEMEDLD